MGSLKMTHGVLIRRLCTEFDNVNAYRIHEVSVVCARRSTSLFTCEFSTILRSSLYGARLYCCACYIHWSSLYGVRQYQRVLIAAALVVCAGSSTFCLCASSLISRGRLCMELDFIVSHATFTWPSLYRARQYQRTAPSSRFGRARTQLDFFVCVQALRFHALVFV